MSTNALAVSYTRRNAPGDPSDILAMLDLLDEAGNVRPDPSPVRPEMPLPKAQVSVVSQQAALVDIRLRPKYSTAPEGLRNLAPVSNAAKPAKPKTPRSPLQMAGPPQELNRSRQAPCGTKTAAKRHSRNGEVRDDGTLLCEACEAGRLERASRNPAVTRAANPMLKEPAACGDLAGYQRHRREHPGQSVTCQPCRDGYNTYRRGRRAKKGRAA